MSQPVPHETWRRLAIGAALVTLLIAVYLVTYTGHAISNDERFLFDATESMARRGNLRQNLYFDNYPPTTLRDAQPPPANTEPLQPALAAPLFLLAQALPAIGLVHTVWLFNVLITAFTAGTLYAYGLAFGYRASVAATVALVFGLGTIVWPYSRTFFREPLFTWLALLSGYLTLRARQQIIAGTRPVWTGLALILAVAGALFAKEAALLLLPALIIQVLPSRLRRVSLTRRGMVVLAGIIVVAGLLTIVLLNADTLFGISGRYAFTQRLEQARGNLSEWSEGVTGYMFSPARSIWLYSPVLLLGFAGWPILWRERRWQQIAVPLTALVTFTIGYAVVRGAEEWYGGRGWGARYLVPVTPFLALWLLPVTDALLHAEAARWKRFGAALIAVLSAGIQMLAILVPLDAYDEALTAHDPPIIPWKGDGVWSVRWSPIRVMWDLLGDQKTELAWQHAVDDAWLLPVLCAALAAAALGGLIFWMRQSSTRRAGIITTATLIALTAITVGSGLYAIRLDPRYYGDFQRTRDLLSGLEPQLQPDDVIVLNNNTYTPFFANYYKQSEPVVYTLPVSPGERFSPEQPTEIESPIPDELVHASDTLILADLGGRHDRLWLIIDSSRFIAWSVRPVEHYLARHYFPVREIAPHDTARAVLFDMTPAPPPTAPRWPATRIDARFGDSLQLIGYDIPGGVTRHPGDVLPVSLLWQAVAPVPQDYTVALFVMADDGQLVAQQDSFPVYGFDPARSWALGSLHRDNHGVALPDTLPPGEYEVWAVVYWWQTPDERLPVTAPTADGTTDHAGLGTIIVAP